MAFWARVESAFAGLPGWAQNLTQAIAFALVAYVVTSVLRKALMSTAGRAILEDTLESFLDNILAVLVWISVVVAFLSGLGVDATALMGGLAVGGFIVGFALKDTLGNLSAGALLLVNRPFSVGEAVELKGHGGIVEDLGIALTRLKTWDGRAVTIPNGTILSEPIVNYSRNPTRRVEITVGVSYDDDVDAAAKAALKVLEDEPRVLDDPAPQVLLKGLGESSVDLRIWAWVPAGELFPATSDLTKAVKQAVEEAGCTIPFPQRDLHLHQTGGDG